MPPKTYATQYKGWQEQNPLRVWRRDNGISIDAAAGMMGVSRSTIQLWESGSSHPNEDNMDLLTRVIGPMFRRRWDKWLDANPMKEHHATEEA